MSRHEITDTGDYIKATIDGFALRIDDSLPVAVIRQLLADIEALKDVLVGEVEANEAFRKAGGALDGEDMPTFCARIIAERDQLRARLADLERASITPVAYQYAHPYFGGGEIWREELRWNGHTSDKARALYAAPPIPDGMVQLREPSDAEFARIAREFYGDIPVNVPHIAGAHIFDAVSKWLKGEL